MLILQWEYWVGSGIALLLGVAAGMLWGAIRRARGDLAALAVVEEVLADRMEVDRQIRAALGMGATGSVIREVQLLVAVNRARDAREKSLTTEVHGSARKGEEKSFTTESTEGTEASPVDSGQLIVDSGEEGTVPRMWETWPNWDISRPYSYVLGSEGDKLPGAEYLTLPDPDAELVQHFNDDDLDRFTDAFLGDMYLAIQRVARPANNTRMAWLAEIKSAQDGFSRLICNLSPKSPAEDLTAESTKGTEKEGTGFDAAAALIAEGRAHG